MRINIPQEVDWIINEIYSNGYEAYAVGGCIRDSLMGRVPEDWDICTSAEPTIIISIFKNKGLKVIPTGLKHGTVTLIYHEHNFEITTYRIDAEYIDNRRPKSVEFARNIREDLLRRDFTMNAMAYNHREGIIDIFGGRDDLAKKIIRCVGKPVERFSEDALRIIRAVRFAAQLSFTVEEESMRAISQTNHYLRFISNDRIREELNKILLAPKPSTGFALLRDLKLLPYTIPELIEAVGFNQRNPHHSKDVYEHILMVVDHTESDLVLRWAALLHDVGKPYCFSLDTKGVGHFYNHHSIGAEMAEEILRRLNFSNQIINQVYILVKEHMNGSENMGVKAIKKFINRVGKENLDRLFKLKVADRKGGKTHPNIESILRFEQKCHEILNNHEPLELVDLQISGHDLKLLGVAEGREIGEILKLLLDHILENPQDNTKEKLLQLAQEHINSSLSK